MLKSAGQMLNVYSSKGIIIIKLNISINVWKIMRDKALLMYLTSKIMLSTFKSNILSLKRFKHYSDSRNIP